MNVNVRFYGAVERILEEAVRQGYAATKTEALRLGAFELNNRYQLLEEVEDNEDVAMADAIMGRVSKGKGKLHSEAEVLKKLK